MKKIVTLFIVLGVLCIGAEGIAADKPEKELIHVILKADRLNAGSTGSAVFAATGEKNSGVRIYIAGVTVLAVGRPLRINTYIYPGSCENLGETPAYSLNNTTIMYRVEGIDAWSAGKRLPAPLSTFRNGSHAIVIRSVPADGNIDLFCGDIR
jgi:hypothetical protein